MEATRERLPRTLALSILVGSLVFIGGFCVMAVELLGGRILAPFFGSSIHVWGSIITIFMLSLSAGYLVGGMISLRHPSLTRFGLIFLVSAVATSPVLFGSDAIMEWVFEGVTDPRYGSLAASFLLFFLPIAAMGMISPYAVRLLVEHHFQSGHVAGKLYFISTMGSALGTIATAFYLVLWLEVSQITGAAAGLLILCGVAAILGDRLLPTRPVEGEPR